MHRRTREASIFYNVIRNETSLTEVFCNLMHYKAFRELFLDFVGITYISLDTISYNNFSTEKNFDKNDKKIRYGRGDLVLEINGLDYIFELKIETTTSLTENQPKGYLEYLKGDKQRLFFILPKAYRDKNKLTSVEHKNILYWENFLDRLKKAELHRLNPFIEAFYATVNERWFYFEKISFASSELNTMYKKEKLHMENSAIPTIMKKLCTIIDEMKSSFKTSWYQNREEYAFFIKDNDNKEILYFGIEYTIWEENGTPLVIGLEVNDDNKKYLENFKKHFDGNIIEKSYKDNLVYQYIPIEKLLLQHTSDTKPIKEKIDEVIGKIKLNIA